MAIKYVEDYRRPEGAESNLDDAETIQAAVDDLKNGDTLMFNKCVESTNSSGSVVYDRTYILDEPVYLTSYKGTTDTGVSRYFVTFDGCGCNIRGSDSFLTTYGGKTDANVKSSSSFFFLSDKKGNGLGRCVIKNFSFRWNAYNNIIYKIDSETNEKTIETVFLHKYRSNGLAVVTYHGSKYFFNGVIENCKFDGFGYGIYQCGDHSAIRNCTFTGCYKGLYSDGSVHNVFEDNYFDCTEYCGIHANVSYDSIIRNNSFYKCKNFSILASGESELSSNAKSIDLTICDNRIFGRKTDVITDADGNAIDGVYVNDYGIKLQGGYNCTVTGNFVHGIGRDKRVVDGVDKGYDSGIGIWVDGNATYSSGDIIVSRKGIISNNHITTCFGKSIKINNAIDYVITGNSVFNEASRGEEGKKYGIFISNNTHNITVSDNNLYYYPDGKRVRISADTTAVSINNNFFNESVTLGYDDSIRVIENTTYSLPTLVLPELSSAFVDGEYFYVKLPMDYTESAVTTIRYNGRDCMLYDSDGLSFDTIPTKMRGYYIKLQYWYHDSVDKFKMFYEDQMKFYK